MDSLKTVLRLFQRTRKAHKTGGSMKQLTMKEYSVLLRKDEKDLTEEERLALYAARESMEKALSGLEPRLRKLRAEFNDISASFEASGLKQQIREIGCALSSAVLKLKELLKEINIPEVSYEQFHDFCVGLELYIASCDGNANQVQAVIDGNKVNALAIMFFYDLACMSHEEALKEAACKYDGVLKETERKYEELQRAASGPSKGGKNSAETRQKNQAEWVAEAQQILNRLYQEKKKFL